ncbi:MAG: BspA family leucine-rich repeat surface protein [Fulvivirga sp.]|uniref:BspA family leucine-rich repeat surface protein n=1 Tax=Fulvivirga sp. TaxID=1931237 RepID=UPI0032EBEDA5
MRLAFFGCSNLTYNATDAPNLTNVTDLYAMFFDVSLFNGEIGSWDVSNINNMQSLFGNTSFNQDISNWDVSNVTNLSQTFFNTPFNQDIGGWDVGNVLTMLNLFLNATDFNQDISSWDVSKVEFFTATFANASSFNANISGWNVGSATNMDNMFAGANSFNQDLSNWDIADVTNMSGMLNSSGISTINYDKLLDGWAAQTVQTGITLGANGLEYCLGATGRATLTDGGGANWTITGDSENCVVNIPDANFKAALLANGTINTVDDGEITYQEAAIVNNLQLAGLGIADLTGIEAFTALNVLAANTNNLTSIDLSNNESLDYLSLSGNDLGEIDLSNNPTLIEVILSNNQLTEIDLSNNSQVTTLWVDQNDISSIELSTNLLLEDLRVDRNPNLSGLNISVNDQLTVLHAYSCNISNLNVSNNTLLEGLFIYGNPITAINLSGLTNLDDLRVDGLSISTLDLSESPNLRFLRASGMGLTSLTLEGSSLVQLFVQNNNLTGALDLSMFPNLTTVRIEQNDFNELDLRNGNNGTITNFNATDNPNLTCISVDDVVFAEANFTNIDAQTEFSTNCNVVYIPDANFKAALLANASINTIDDGEITFEEAEAYTGSINASNQSIQDLTGIEAFSNLTGLLAGNNSVVSVDLSSNPDLVTLVLSDNDLTSLDLANNSSIATLYVQRNSSLSGLSVTNLVDLNDLDASNTLVDAIDLSANSTLTFISLNSTSITTLDLSSNNDLSSVSLSSTSLESLDLRNGANASIGTLNLTGNPNLTCISVDDVAYAEANFTNVDEVANFSTNCSNTANDITAFSFTEQAIDAIIDTENHTVVIDVVSGTDFTNLTPTFTVSDGATADPASGVAQDFSSAFVYTLTAENPTAVQEWTVTVREENVAPTDITLNNSSIDENNALDDVIGSFSSADVNDTDMHSYSLVSGDGDTDNASFDISGSNLIAKEVFDFEIVSSYSIRVQSNDGRGGTFEKEFTISINDVDDQEAQEITFNAIENQFFEAGSLTLSATASSGLAVAFDLVSGPGTLAGNVVTFTDLGTIVVSASQAGNGAFFPADPVEQSFEVITVTGLEGESSALLVFPNPAADVLTVQTQEENITLQLLNIRGSEVMSIRPNVSTDISQLDKGIYFLLISNSKGVTTHKIIKQ